MRFLSPALLCVLVIYAAGAQPPFPPPAQPIPSPLQQIMEVHQWSPDKGTVALRSDQVTYSTEQREVEATVIENGIPMKVKKTVNLTVPVMVKQVSQYVLKGFKATDVDGKVLSPEEVFKRLPVGSAVLVFPEGYQLPSSHRRLFSKDAVILTPKNQVPLKEGATK